MADLAHQAGLMPNLPTPVGGDANRPRSIPPADRLFSVVVWLDELGWATVAWTMTRIDADNIADLYFAHDHYIAAEVWHQGQRVAERIKPDPQEQSEWSTLSLAEKGRSKAAWLNAQGKDVCPVCLALRDAGVCRWCPTEAVARG